MLLPACLFASFLLFQSVGNPITTLVQSMPAGNNFSLEVTPDDKLAFYAEGATIEILDLNSTPLQPFTPIPVPNCQPLALRYYQPPSTSDHWLFIAGGD